MGETKEVAKVILGFTETMFSQRNVSLTSSYDCVPSWFDEALRACIPLILILSEGVQPHT